MTNQAVSGTMMTDDDGGGGSDDDDDVSYKYFQTDPHHNYMVILVQTDHGDIHNCPQ